MATIQAWFISLLTGPWNPIWTPYIGSVVAALVVLVIIAGAIVFTLSALDVYFEALLVWFWAFVVWMVYIVLAAIILFPNWGGLSVFGLQ